MKKVLILGASALLIILGVVVFFVFQSSRQSVRTDSPQGSSGKPASVSASAVSPVQKPKLIPAAPSSKADPIQQIADIRRELQTVMELNQKINAVQTAKSTQLLRIQEQASIHQRILASIQKTAPAMNSALPSREALLAQEKLRIIREETLRNKKVLESVQKN